MKKGYSTWSSFAWHKKQSTNQLLNRTFLARGHYDHKDGSRYYSIYDLKGKWYGYLNAKATKVATNSAGVWHGVDHYVTLTKTGYPLWRAFFSGRISTTSAQYQKTFHATGEYYAANNSRYYSLYDEAGRWWGYVNTTATSTGTGIQGAWLKTNGYATVTNTSYPLWHGFFNGQATNPAQVTYHVTGQYHALTGETYLSLYDEKGHWRGYVNAKAVKFASGSQGAWLADTHYFKVLHSAYPFWKSFFKGQYGTTTSALSMTYHTNGRYHHLNGSIYFSVYDSANRWQGYLNANATAALTTAPVNGFALSAHRGDHQLAPENSLQAMDAAAAAGFGLDEIDVQATRDHQYVLMHDATINRTTTGSGAVANLTLAQIRVVNLRVEANSTYVGQSLKVPTVDQAITTAGQHGMFLNLDGSKGNWSDTAFTDHIVNALKANGIYDRSFFVLSDAKIRQHFMARYPDARVTWLYSPHTSIEATLLALQQYPHALLSISASQVTPGIIALMRASGMAIHVYGVNDVALAESLKQQGVNYIETDTIQPKQVQ